MQAALCVANVLKAYFACFGFMSSRSGLNSFTSRSNWRKCNCKDVSFSVTTSSRLTLFHLSKLSLISSKVYFSFFNDSIRFN